MRNAIETKNLTKVYKNFTAVNSLNLKVPEKSIFGLLGPNGAGKTTTIKMLTCLIQPTSGHASVGGYDVQENPNEVRNLLGMVPQQVSLYKDLTVQENSELCADYYGVPVDEKHDRIEDLMELVDIKYARNKRVGQLSGGQKQRVAIARALINHPRILLADEPTGALDQASGKQVMELFKALNDEGVTIIMITHDANIANHAKKVLHIFDGEIVEDKERKEKQQAEVQSEKEAKNDTVFSEIEQDFGVKEWEGEI